MSLRSWLWYCYWTWFISQVIAVAGIWLCEKNLIWVVNIIHSSFQFTLCWRVCICPLTLDRMFLVSRWYLWWPTTAIRKNDINLLMLDWTLIILNWKWSETKKLKTYFLFHWTGNRLIFFYFQLKTKHLKLVCVISSFYKAFVQFWTHSIELTLKQFLNSSAEENPFCIFFSGAFNIMLVNSFILVWHSNYELSGKTQKPFFILKESSKCHILYYQSKNQVVMFRFGLQSIARFINMNTSYFNTHRLENEGKFSRNF